MRNWRGYSNDASVARRTAGWSVLVFLLTAGLLLSVSYTQYLRNDADLEAATRVQAVETAVRLQQEIDHHLKLLTVLRDSLSRSGRVNPDAFRVEAGAITRAWPAFQAINWIDPDGRMRVVVPMAGNEAAADLDVLDVPDAVSAFRRGLDGTGVAATPPLELRQGGRGVTTYLAVRENGEVRGVINGVFRLDALFSGLLSAGLLERYAIRVTDGARPVYAAGEIGAQFVNLPRTSVSFDDRSWQLQVAPRIERVADFAGQFHEQILGIVSVALLAALLTGLLAYKQVSLRQTEQRFRDLNRLLPDMVLECNENWRVDYLNHRARAHLGYTDNDVAAGLALGALLDMDDMDDVLAALPGAQRGDHPVNRVCKVACRDGSTTSCEVTLGAIHDEAGRFRGARAVMRDITERLEAERTMNRLANFDATTQLPNRAMFMQVLEHEIRQAAAHERRLVLMVIDLDNFKSINDRLGPSTGDHLLREAGQRLRDALQGQEYVFRVSGDEFAVLFHAHDAHENMEGVAQLLLSALRQPYRLHGGIEETVDATVGISVYPDDADNSEQLYMHADTAVYEAKAHGGRRFRIFSPEISRQLNERKQIEESLRHALQRDEFRLYYQPVIDARQGCIIGVEALLRWQHPLRGLLAPFHFVLLAEETGMIDAIGAWVLQEACRQMTEWDALGLRLPQVAVNVSARQLESGVLATDVRRALRDHRMDGERLVLELTESLLMRDVHFAARTLAGLRQHGVRIAVDDFGTGYSSLAYLHRLPIDSLKIDRAFIAPIAEADGDTRVTEAVIALGRSLKLHIVAEGVERAAQAEFLLEQGCTSMQGFYFSRPVPAARIAALVKRDWRPATLPHRPSVRMQ